jgi:hypothetical protein
VRRIDRAEVAFQRVPRDLAEGASELGACRACTDDDECHPFGPADRVRLALRGLEGDEDPAADFDGVLE